MSGANAISGITMLAALTLIVKAEGNVPLLIIGSVSLGFALFNVVGGFFVTDRMPRCLVVNHQIRSNF